MPGHHGCCPRRILIGSAAGGCCFAVGDGAGAAVFWDPAVHPAVLVAAAEPAVSVSPDTFDLHRFEALATVLQQPDGIEHVLLSDGLRHLQLLVTEGSVVGGPVRLHYRLSGFSGIEAGVLTLRQLCSLHSLGRLQHGLFATESRSSRFLSLLRAHDGWREGASYRDIAAVLFGGQTVREDWGGRSDYLRLRVQRLLRGARQLLTGGYRKLLL